MKPRKSTIISRMFDGLEQVELVDIKVLPRRKGLWGQPAEHEAATIHEEGAPSTHAPNVLDFKTLT